MLRSNTLRLSFGYPGWIMPAAYKPPLSMRIRNTFKQRVPIVFESIIQDAIETAELPKTVDIPEISSWRRLIDAFNDKPFLSPMGTAFIRMKLVHILSQRLLVEERFKEYAHEMEDESFSPEDAIIIIGLPRSMGHVLHHVMASTGTVLAPSSADILCPGTERILDRRAQLKPILKMTNKCHNTFTSVRLLNAQWAEDDLHLQLLKPESMAWGWLFGLEDYTKERINTPEVMADVYAFEAKVLRLFRVYRDMGQFPELVDLQINPLECPVEVVRYGLRDTNLPMPWVIHSPLAMCYLPEMLTAFPKAKIVWAHRALNQCIPSTCGALMQHEIMHTHRTPLDSQLISMGTKVLGFFGSGTERALDTLATYPTERFINVYNRDLNRGAMRVVKKLLPRLGVQLDRWRMTQGISGFAYYYSNYHAKHVYKLDHFGITEAQIGEIFRAYIEQFEEYAFEPVHGITRELISEASVSTSVGEVEAFKKHGQRSPILFDPQGHGGDTRE
eukprot:PhM_4_TR11390/c0_g1_i1/m.84242